MGKVKGKHRLDKFYRLAKEHGYRSRASWKLIQLDTKHRFLHSSRSVLDLCAAPGGWMQVAVQRVPVGSLVLGVDLVRIAPIRGAISIEQDITKPECRSKIKRVMEENNVNVFDLILHDGSPNIGGAWTQEAVAQNALVVDALKLATQFLSRNGTFVSKIFRSQDYSSVMYCLNQLFEKVEVVKPSASRSTSAEIFVVGLKYKAPAKVDPRLLDVKHLFQASVDPPRKAIDVLRKTKEKRHRDGYEDGVSLLSKEASAADFVWSDTPLEVLGSVTCISLSNEASLPIKDHPLTTEEVKMLCDDLRVLSKQDFKHLLKWRLNIRKALTSEKAISSEAAGDKVGDDDDDEKVLNEMKELKEALDRKKKKAKKHTAKRQAKEKMRKATGMQIDVLEDGYMERDLFSLASIKGEKDLVAIDSAECDENGDTEDDEKTVDDALEEASDADSDEERRRYDEHVEDLLDKAYEQFLAKRGEHKEQKRTKLTSPEDLEESDDQSPNASEGESDKEGADERENPLVVRFNEKAPSQEEITNKWFSQDVFLKAEEPEIMGRRGKVDAIPKRSRVQDDENGEDTTRVTAITPPALGTDGFEIVPAPATDSSDDDSSSDISDDDIDAKAQTLACAKKMLRKKMREEIIDNGYHKYMFHDDNLPAWFVDDEKRHRQPVKPVTKEEVAEMRALFKDINARPAKKVAEAKARKKRAAMRKLDKARKKANTISDQNDISERSKMKMIEQVYKKAAPTRPKKEYVVAKKGVGVRGGKGRVVVDRRMKKDRRVRGMGKPGVSTAKKGGKKTTGKMGKRAASVPAQKSKGMRMPKRRRA